MTDSTLRADGPLWGRPPEELARDLTWLRRLATALVRDEASADDLVQDTFLVASKRSDEVRDVRAFLGGMLRRLAKRTARGASRRAHREQRASRPDGAPAADEWAERVDTLRIVLEELRELSPARRRLLGLRLLDGLEPTEIAEREGLAASTVRAQCARGLAELRERLDRRAGGREAWSAALVSWSDIGSGPPAALAGRSIAPSSASPPTAAAIPLGLLPMITPAKLTLALTSVVAAALLWPEPSVPTDVATADPPAAQTAKADTARPTTTTGLGPALATDPAPPVREAATPPAVPESVPVAIAVRPIRTRLIDAATGEPVPHGLLSVRRPTSANETLEADAAARIEGWLEESETVQIAFRDRTDDLDGVPSYVEYQLPLPADLPVRVGPTFFFPTPLPHGLRAEELNATFEIPGRSTWESPSVPLRAGSPCWARFPYLIATLPGAGPWTLRVEDREGYWVGRAEVTRKVGIEQAPIDLEFSERGAVRFVVAPEPGVNWRERVVELLDGEGEFLRYVGLVVDAETGTGVATPARGETRHLAPGQYEWRLGGGEGRRASFEVVAGATTEIEIPAENAVTIDPTFDLDVPIDVSANPDLDLEHAMALLMSADDPTMRVEAPIERWREAGPGQWRVRIRGLAAGSWSLAVAGATPNEKWSPPVQRISPGSVPRPIRFVALGPPVQLSILLRDGVGNELHGGEGIFSLGGPSSQVLLQDGSGRFAPLTAPSGETARLIVRAPGFRAQAVDLDVPAKDETVTVTLEPGWSNRVRVFETETMQPFSGAGVIVDGALRGRTDERGELWLTGEGPPTRVDLDPETCTIVVTGARRADGVTDPISGYVFIARRP